MPRPLDCLRKAWYTTGMDKSMKHKIERKVVTFRFPVRVIDRLRRHVKKDPCVSMNGWVLRVVLDALADESPGTSGR